MEGAVERWMSAKYALERRLETVGQDSETGFAAALPPERLDEVVMPEPKLYKSLYR